MPKLLTKPNILERNKTYAKIFKDKRVNGPYYRIEYGQKVRDAYFNRKRFNELSTKYPLTKYVILKKFGLTPEEIKIAQITNSETTPAINIYIPTKNKNLGYSSVKKIKGLGELYVNLIYESEHQSTSFKHEEEHTRLALKRFYKGKIETYTDVYEFTLQELTAELATFKDATNYDPITQAFVEVQIPKFMVKAIDHLFTELEENNKNLRPEVYEANKRHAKFIIKQIVTEIRTQLLLNNLNMQEIIRILESLQDIHDAVSALKKYSQYKYRLSKKKK